MDKAPRSRHGYSVDERRWLEDEDDGDWWRKKERWQRLASLETRSEPSRGPNWEALEHLQVNLHPILSVDYNRRLGE